MKRFLKEKKIDKYCQYLEKDLPILENTGEIISFIDFDFQANSTEFLESIEKVTEEIDNDSSLIKTHVLNETLNEQTNLIDSLKLNDKDLEQLLIILGKNTKYNGEVIISGHNITDQTTIRLSKILKQNHPNIIGLNLSQSNLTYLSGQHLGDALVENKTLFKINLGGVTLGTSGANRLIEALHKNKTIREYNFGNLTDSSFQYLITYLGQDHNLKYLIFGEDLSEPWKEETKEKFIMVIRNNQDSSNILSIEITCDELDQQHRHNNFIAELSILCKNHRNSYILKKNNDYKSKELNTQHPEYYDSDNHAENAFKFSVKTYIQNVIETLLDEGLYFLERERANMMRDEQIFEITKNPINKSILEDLMTADGSILVLAKYMIQKIEEKPELGGEF